jgi:hypothetical protein
MFGESRATTTPNLYETSTMLFTELDLATELGWSLQEYSEKLDWAQRKMKLYHRILKNEKEKYQIDKVQREQELERKRKENLPREEIRDRPGVRRY